MKPSDLYEAIKARVIAYEFPQGEWIHLEPIAKELDVSTWSVREVFERLAAEGLVFKGPRTGFFATTLFEKEVTGQYQINRHLLSLGLETLEPAACRQLVEHEPTAELLDRLNRRVQLDGDTLARMTAQLFAGIAELTGKPAIVLMIGTTNDRLYHLRTLECRLLKDVQSELVRLCELLLAGDCETLVTEVNTYHDRRLAIVPELLELSRR